PFHPAREDAQDGAREPPARTRAQAPKRNRRSRAARVESRDQRVCRKDATAALDHVALHARDPATSRPCRAETRRASPHLAMVQYPGALPRQRQDAVTRRPDADAPREEPERAAQTRRRQAEPARPA